MKNTYHTLTTWLATALLGLLLTAPEAGAQNRTTPANPQPLPGTGQAKPAAPATAGTLAPLISNKIQFHGQVPDMQTNYRANPLDVCPNVVDPVNHGIQSQPYQFQFESNCLGNNASTDCRFRPNFIWTVKYYTEAGNTYTEQWQDKTAGDFSKIRLYFYDRVPYTTFPLTPTNGQATQAGGNPNFSAVPYPNTGCLLAAVNTAQAGEVITSVRLECTGYSCGFFEGDDDDAIIIRYYNRRPEAITVDGEQPLCRDATYPISVSPVLGATNYLWYTSGLNGAVISNVNGTNATLNLSGVPAGTTSITLRVAAQSTTQCGGTISSPRDLVVNLAPSPGVPANLQLNNGLCPTTGTNTKGVSVTNVPNAARYRWTISGAGSTFSDGSTTRETTTEDTQIRTPQVGQVTVTAAMKLSDCNGYGAAISRTFQIGNLEPVCVEPVYQRGPCDQRSFSLVFEANPTGLKYYPGTIRNVTNGGMPTITQSTTGSPVFIVNMATGPSGRFSFDLDYYVQSDCPSGPGFVACSTTVSVGKYIPGPCRTAPTPAPTMEPELFPNPTSGNVEIRPTQPTSYQWLKVYDMTGNLRYEDHNKAAEGIKSFNIRSLATGLYQIQLFDGERLTTQRLVKE